MIYQVLLEMPDETQVDAVDQNGDYVLGNDVVYQISLLNSKWPKFRAPRTQAVAGRKLVHAMIETTSSNPDLLIEALIANYNLDWQLLGMQTFPVPTKIIEPNAARIFEFLIPQYTYDDNMQVTGELTKAMSWVSTYSGRGEWLA